MNALHEILFVSSYPPRECGIASYTQDLVRSVNEKFSSSFSLRICAIETKDGNRLYPEEVKYILRSTSEECIEMAGKINLDTTIKLVFIQHEFGLFGDNYGENLLYFLYTLNKPVLVSFHTVLPGPDDKLKKIVQAIERACEGIVVMTKNSSEILQKEYGISPDKISVIYHGTHLVGSPDRKNMKKRYGLGDRPVLSTFGLLNPGKSIETALDALPAILEIFPDTIYLVIGSTHPEVVKREGEKYREFLETKVADLRIENNVKFINRYLSLDELLEYLQLTDIYLFTSNDPNQAVSGTFSYAMGCACPVISTPIPHAREMLSGECGIIVDFNEPKQLSEAAIKLLSDPAERKHMSLNALHKIRPTSWQNSALAHTELFERATGNNIQINYSIPGISLDHIRRLTTGSGMIQFADICRPDPESGYTLDDNARALIAVIKHYEMTGEPEDIKLIDIYLNYIKFSQQPDGKFLNYVDQYGMYHDKNNYVNLEDSSGRAVWALGEFLFRKDLFHEYYSKRAEGIIQKSLEHIKKFESPRAIAFSIKGLYHYNRVKKSNGIKVLIAGLADNLISKYHCVFENGWEWFENYLTYANSVLPESLLYAYLETGNELYKHIARSSFDFLLSHTFTGKEIKVISNRGWHCKGGEKNKFGEQPIDIAYTILSLDLFYEVFGDEEYNKKIFAAFSWFHGNNHLRQIIYNPVTGGCQDGLEEHNINLNQGAESTVCYLMAREVMAKYEMMEKQGATSTELVYIPLISENYKKAV